MRVNRVMQSVRHASVIVHDYESNEVAISLIESLGKMAESKGSLFSKSVVKHAGRAKEKVCVLVSVYRCYKFPIHENKQKMQEQIRKKTNKINNTHTTGIIIRR